MALDEKKKKMIAPAAITAIFLIYLIAYIAALIIFADIWLIFLAVPLVILGIAMIVTLHTPIKEIRSGEEDDLGNY